jgi:hypothetical protein
MRRRVTDLEKEQRIETILQLLARSVPSSRIVSLLAEQWQISERHAYRYLIEAKRREAELGDSSLTVLTGQALNRISLLYNQAMTNGDLKTGDKAIGRMLQLHKQLVKNKGGENVQDFTAETTAISPGLAGYLQRLKSTESTQQSEDSV